MVPRDGHHRRAQPPQECGGLVVLGASAAVCQVAGRDDQIGPGLSHEIADRIMDHGVVARAEMEIRQVQDARSHRRSRLYSE